jgi:hypothetical protein
VRTLFRGAIGRAAHHHQAVRPRNQVRNDDYTDEAEK